MLGSCLRLRLSGQPVRPAGRHGGILFNYEQCFECGTCYIACNQEGAIRWFYPDGGYGSRSGVLEG